MEAILKNNPALKRLLVALGTGALVALNKKLGLGLDHAEMAGLVVLAVGYIAQSGLKSAAEAKAIGETAATNVKTVEDADKVMGGGK